MDRHLTEMEARLKIGSEGGEAVDLAAIFEDLGHPSEAQPPPR